MTKMNGLTPDIAQENIERLQAIFPDVFEEGKVDFDKLKQDLGEYVDDAKERYNFTWNGKGRALRLAQTPSAGTLRPYPEESKDWDTTQNLYIEGDNLEVLKLLQKSYHGKVKMIYIDPPYNTGGDFVYPDDFSDSIENYKRLTGQVDEEGKRWGTNTESNGRYHTDWLNMMYPRLRLARNLLADDGVIFISIDDNEAANLTKVCDEVFGESCFVCGAIWRSSDNSNNDAKQFSNDHNTTLIYSKQPLWQPEKYDDDSKRSHFKNPNNDPKGAWFDGNPLNSPNYRENLIYNIVAPNGYVIAPPKNGWRWSEETVKQKMADGEIYFNADMTNIKRRTYLCNMKGLPPSSLWIDLEKTGHNRQAKYELLDIMPENVFDTPKPVKLIRYILDLVQNNQDAIIMDFFSGAATTADAIMQANASDGGCRKYILVQLPEDLDASLEKASNDKKQVLKNAIALCDKLGRNHKLTEIGKERIRRAGEKIKGELREKYTAYQNRQQSLLDETTDAPMNPDALDVGFKVFKLDSSNLKKWQPDYDALETTLLDSVENYVYGRTEKDVVYEIALKLGLDLSYPVERHEIAGKNVYTIGFGALMICLDNDITTDVATGMVELHKQMRPEMWKVVFKDNGFKDDSTKTNVREILKCAGLDEDAFTTV